MVERIMTGQSKNGYGIGSFFLDLINKEKYIAWIKEQYPGEYEKAMIEEWIKNHCLEDGEGAITKDEYDEEYTIQEKWDILDKAAELLSHKYGCDSSIYAFLIDYIQEKMNICLSYVEGYDTSALMLEERLPFESSSAERELNYMELNDFFDEHIIKPFWDEYECIYAVSLSIPLYCECDREADQTIHKILEEYASKNDMDDSLDEEEYEAEEELEIQENEIIESSVEDDEADEEIRNLLYPVRSAEERIEDYLGNIDEFDELYDEKCRKAFIEQRVPYMSDEWKCGFNYAVGVAEELDEKKLVAGSPLFCAFVRLENVLCKLRPDDAHLLIEKLATLDFNDEHLEEKLRNIKDDLLPRF